MTQQHYLTPQEIFTKVVTHLRKQGQQALRQSYGTCMYRLGDLKCAAGCLIADEHYDRRIENHSVPFRSEDEAMLDEYQQVLRNALLSSGVAFKDFRLVSRLQGIHDGSSDTEFWETNWKILSEEYNLEMPPK